MGRPPLTSLYASNPRGVSGAAISTRGGPGQIEPGAVVRVRVVAAETGDLVGPTHREPRRPRVAPILHGLGKGLVLHRPARGLQRVHQPEVHVEGAHDAVALVRGVTCGRGVRLAGGLGVCPGGLLACVVLDHVLDLLGQPHTLHQSMKEPVTDFTREPKALVREVRWRCRRRVGTETGRRALPPSG
jgi:hypothetical protein